MGIIYKKEELPEPCEITKFMSDRTGKKYNKLTFIYPFRNNKKEIRWICQCECGNYIEVIPSNVLKGNTKSCGCLNKEKPT